MALGANPWVKVYLIWRRPTADATLPSCKIWAWSRKQSTRCALPKFVTFWPWTKVHQKGRWPATHLDLSSRKISSPCVNPCRRYPLQNKDHNKQ